jgi:hypothetical protein
MFWQRRMRELTRYRCATCKKYPTEWRDLQQKKRAHAMEPREPFLSGLIAAARGGTA